MKMTIDEAIKKLSTSALIIGPEDWGEARDILISTARKYQKIEEIYKNEYKEYKIGDRGFSKEVRKVLDNGNDD